MREKFVEQKLIRLVEKMGGLAIKFVSPQSVGWPDRIVLLPGGKIIFVEVKQTTGRLSKMQEYRLKQLEKLGFETHVIYGENEIEKITRLSE